MNIIQKTKYGVAINVTIEMGGLYYMEKCKISDILTQLKKSKNVSLTEISNKSGLSRSYLSRLNNGTRLPSLHSLIKLCNYYSIQPNTLLQALCDAENEEKCNIIDINNIISIDDMNIDIKMILKEFLDRLDQYCDNEVLINDGVKLLELIHDINENVLELIRVKEGELNEKK